MGFTCNIGDRTLRGIVREKHDAKATYDKAVSRGETAGLLQQLPEAADAFRTSLGNIPAGGKVLVTITYVSELKHDAEADGIRWTLPTKLAPRYGGAPSDLTETSAKTAQEVDGISIIVDVDVGASSYIQGLQSPSHPIAVTMGKISTSSSDDPVMHKASATLALGTTQLDDDFVLIVSNKDNGMPTAFLETHSSIPNQRALMVDLVPKFSLPPGRPEIIFVADRSGSMARQIPTLISALKVFLKSLPVGLKFNILSFGTRHSFLWPKSKAYSKESLAEAMKHVEQFSANMGGTETFAALKTAIENRYKDLACEIMLLTDGNIWNQNDLFSHLNDVVGNDIRLFTLGIGGGVSSALIEGVARAGKGFAQTVAENEKMDKKVVRMLKGALSPHIYDYTMEVKYKGESEQSQDMEWDLVEKVTDKLKIVDPMDTHKETPKVDQKPISLFDAEVQMDEPELAMSKSWDTGDPFKGVPEVTVPKLLQAPHSIPPLFPFTKTTVYLLMFPECTQKIPKSVILRGTSPQGPLELEIPVQVLAESGKKIHQLAAKKAMQELEEDRGWLHSAKNEKTNALLKTEYASYFDQMVQREAVRLGVQFQVGGKYCSFVAVADSEKSPNHIIDTPSESEKSYKDDGYGPTVRKRARGPSVSFEASGCKKASAPSTRSASLSKRGGVSSSDDDEDENEDMGFEVLDDAGDVQGQRFGQRASAPGRGSYSASRATPRSAAAPLGIEYHRRGGEGGRGGGKSTTPWQRRGGANRSAAAFASHHTSAMGRSAMPAAPPPQLAQAGRQRRKLAKGGATTTANASAEPTMPQTDSEKIHALIDLQDFEGYWTSDGKLLAILGLEAHMVRDQDAFVTVLVIHFLELKMAAEKELWELVVDKAKEWLVGTGADVGALENEAKKAFEKCGK